MNYPLISEYVEAIKAAEDNFEQLKDLRPVLGEDGEPVMTSGNFAVVFKMKDEQTGKLHAVKCFLKEQEGRAEAYRQIAEELEYVSSTFLTPIKYLDMELFVDSSNSEDSEFPVLLMDWVEGQTLDNYIREHIDDQYDLSLLAYQFSRLAMWLMPQPFAHGDLKPDNILVKEDGTLVLVDYDGMYVPAMKGQKARELGSLDFRHPGRTENVFDEHIDDFSLASILLSLKAIALQPDLLEEYGASDRLLFSEKDYRNLSESSVLDALKPLMQDAELASLYSLYILALSQSNLSQVSFRLFNFSRPERPQYEEVNLSSEVTKEDLANAWIDEYGVMYSKDRKRLLKAPQNIEEYVIKGGTKVICNSAFRDCYFLESIYIPNSVIEIGERSFCGCCLENVTIPLGVRIIGDLAFAMMGVRLSIIIPNSVTTIGAAAFSGCRIKILRIPEGMTRVEDGTFYNCDLNSIIIPNSVTEIGDDAFDDRVILKAIYVPAGTRRKFETLLPKYKDEIIESDDFISAWTDNYGVMYSSDRKRLLKATKPLQEYFVLDNTTIIKSNAFKHCDIISVTISDGVLEIEDEAFAWCKRLKNVTLPNSLIKIGNSAFEECCFSSFNLPNGLLEIGKSAFYHCNSLTSIFIPKIVRIIGEYAFSLCENLTKIDVDINNPFYDSRDNCNAIIETKSNILVSGCSTTTIPNSVNKICNGAFSMVSSLSMINIHNVEAIGDYSFWGAGLISLDLPDSVNTIGKYSFSYCSNLMSINLSNSLHEIPERAFERCNKIVNVIIPKGVKRICYGAFEECEELVSVTFPDSLVEIEGRAFYDCRKINKIILPPSLEVVAKDCFERCCLYSIIIPKGTRQRFEKLLPEYKYKLIEQD